MQGPRNRGPDSRGLKPRGGRPVSGQQGQQLPARPMRGQYNKERGGLATGDRRIRQRLAQPKVQKNVTIRGDK